MEGKAAPTQTVPCVVEREGKRVLESLRWGLIPFWAKDAKISYKTIWYSPYKQI
ncbi:SOS response-associated peptidase family protein [Paenibacillus taihuensis]|uniref:SOS response-associated peptidase family protein n=1 Tax=Paenibacillus taihuensis TaxID=1156355 RepID=UPI000E226B1C|nr:SOS response-associated peptidase family protein [Paenibacillus taihuensis]